MNTYTHPRAHRAHLLVVTLNGSSLIRFDQHIDHSAISVTYLTDQTRGELVSCYRDQVADLVVINDPTDTQGEVFDAAGAVFRRHGIADAVFAPSECDLLTAAQVRGKFGIPGMTESQTRDFRDKVRMKRRVATAGLPTPRFGECGVRHGAAELINEIGYPVVLKPRCGMGSFGVYVVRDPTELERVWSAIDPETYEVEEFVSGPIYHVDGLMHTGRLVFSQTSQYLNTCLDTARDRVPLGSVVVDDDVLHGRLREFATACLTALSLREGAFHLEVILRDGRDPVFLEVGARVGGGQIHMMFRDVYGIDLIRESVKLELGQQPAVPRALNRVGGWLVVPAPCPPPYQIVQRTSLTGRVPYLYYEALPQVGEIYDVSRLRQDRWPGGRFRFSGPSTTDVTAAINESMLRYQTNVIRLADNHVTAN